MKKQLLLLLAFGALLTAAAAEKIDVGAGKVAHLTLPTDWKRTELGADSPAAGKSAHYVTKNGSNDEVLISLLPTAGDRTGDQENLRAMAEIATAQFVTGSVEGKADFKEVKFGGATGLTVTFTDASLVDKPSTKGDFKVVTACFFYLSENILVAATIFSADVKSQAYADSLRIVKSMSLTQTKDNI